MVMGIPGTEKHKQERDRNDGFIGSDSSVRDTAGKKVVAQLCKAMNTKPRTLDFIPGWQCRLLNRRASGSEICFRKVTVTASGSGAGKGAECCTPTCRGRAAWRNALPAPFPAARVPSRRARNSSSPPGHAPSVLS